MTDFQMKKNAFVHSGVVRYEDPEKNRVIVHAQKDGSAFSVTIKPADESFRVKKIELKHPYDLNGIHYNIEKTSEDKEGAEDDFRKFKENEAMTLLQKANELISQWVQIARLLAMWNGLPNLRKITSMNDEDYSQTTLNILEALCEYPEMEQLVKLFQEAFAKKPEGGVTK